MPGVVEVTGILTTMRSLPFFPRVQSISLFSLQIFITQAHPIYSFQYHFHQTIYLFKQRHKMVPNHLKIIAQSIYNHLSSIIVTGLLKQPCDLYKLTSDHSVYIHTSILNLPNSSHFSFPYHSFFPHSF